jgi:NADH dehydrogenase
LPYDHLVLAAGAVTATFGIPGVEEYGFGLKNLDDAIRVRSHLLDQFEQAAIRPSLIAEGALNVVIVGGGPTGVELAGAVAELFHKVLAKDFPQLQVSRARVILIEAMNSLLGPFSEPSQRHALEMLRERGVEVLLGRAVARVTPDEVELKDGEVLPARTLMWAAGVRASPLADVLGLEQTRGGRLVVNPDLSVPGRPDVWVIGDLAASTDPEGKLHPQVAPVAIQGARHVAKQIQLAIAGDSSGDSRATFKYTDKGSMATIGRGAAVAELPPGLRFQGFLAWLMWLFLHLMTLVGFRNRASVMLDWAWGFFTHDRAARIVVQAPPPREAVATAAPASPPV